MRSTKSKISVKRLFIFESHPVQYHAPVYAALHRRCEASGGAAIHVVYAMDNGGGNGRYDPEFRRRVAWDEPLRNGYPCTVLGNERTEAPLRFGDLSGRGVFTLLRSNKPSAVLLTKLRHQFDWAAYSSALLLRIPIWLRMETQDAAVARGAVKSLIRGAAYRAAYFPVARAFPIGLLNRSHYRRHGFREEQLSASPYCVVDRFAGWSPAEKESRRDRLRQELLIPPEKTALLFCGKLQEKKNPQLILDAMAGMAPLERQSFAVIYVGTGALEPALRAQSASLPDVQTIFGGFKNQTELPDWYLASDALVLPSRQMGETWGLVANEALLAERRLILSRHAGCHADFMHLPSVRVFDGSRQGLIESLRSLPAEASAQGARHFLRAYSVAAAAEGIAAALNLPPARTVSSAASQPMLAAV